MTDDLSDDEIVARLESALRRMPRLRREIFLAVRLDHLSYAEVAERTGLTVAEVQGHVAAALYVIARHLDGKPARWW